MTKIDSKINQSLIEEKFQKSSKRQICIPSPDPALWSLDEHTKDYLCIHGFTQDLSTTSLLKSRRCYSSTFKGRNRKFYRYFKKSYLKRTLKNGEKIRRDFLVYSESKGVLFCYPCLLFGCKSPFATTGFSQWHKAEKSIIVHSNSSVHRSNMIKMKQRGIIHNSIDSRLECQNEGERVYWVNVLKRVVATVKMLASRGLAYRVETSTDGLNNNGDFLMAIELIAKFDPFMSEYIKRYGNPGSSQNTSYISSNTYKEIINVMSKKVQSTIIKKMNDSHYFSIIVDSAPGISHVDKLSLCVRYVNKEDGNPVERFLCFLDHVGYNVEDMAEAIFKTLRNYNLKVKNLRGQSYDNACNMAGLYTALQTRIKTANPLAKSVPCAAHSLNLVGMNAMSCCTEAVSFFDFLQNVYNFFSVSTRRWKILNKSVNSLSETKWSERDDVCKSLNENWSLVLNALNEIKYDQREKAATRTEAKEIKRKLYHLETGFLTIFWNNILQRFNVVGKSIQSANMDLGVVVELYNSLIVYVTDFRSDEVYEHFKSLAVQKTNITEFKNKRPIKRRKYFDGRPANDTELNNTESFKVHTYFVMLDELTRELKKRKESYECLLENYQFFFKLTTMPVADVYTCAARLQKEYPNDLEPCFISECLHFRGHLKSIRTNAPHTIQDMCAFINQKDVVNIYPNIGISLRMLMCTPVSNCSTERLLSALKRVKSYLGSRSNENRLDSSAIMTIEGDLTSNIDFSGVIEEFVENNFFN